MRRTTTFAVGLFVALALLTSMAAGFATATEETDEFHVALDSDGNADVKVQFVYDLENDAERDAFEELSTNETVRAALRERFENRMDAVAADASESTDREMTVTDVSVDFHVERGGDVGVVSISFHWAGLAAVEDDRLVVTEPFASGFETDRRFTVTMPADYSVTSATPEPTSSESTSVSWDAGSNVEGFELVAERGDGDADSDGDGAGFGVVAAVVGIVGGALSSRFR